MERKGVKWLGMEELELFQSMLGIHKHTIDSKKRIILPSEYRSFLGTQVVISKSTDKCIKVFSISAWKALDEKIKALPSEELRVLRRWLYANSKLAEIDSQGRIAIPQHLCEYAGLEKNVVTLGAGDYAEIWSEEEYLGGDVEVTNESIRDMLSKNNL